MPKQLDLDLGIEKEVADAPPRPFKVVTTSYYEEWHEGVRRVRCVQHETQDIKMSPHNPIQSYRAYYL